MYKDKLLALANYLEGIEDGRFNLSFWATKDFNECRSCGCAIGHATTIFKAQGFYLKKGTNGMMIPRYQEYKGWAAVRVFFGLDGPDDEYLFDGISYDDPSRASVIKRIREFVDAQDNY